MHSISFIYWQFLFKDFLNMQKQILEICLDISFEFFKIMLIAESDRHYQITSSIVDDIWFTICLLRLPLVSTLAYFFYYANCKQAADWI